MFETTYRPATVRAILTGVIALMLLCVFSWSLGAVIKWVGAPFLLLPDALGLARQVQRQEIMPFDLNVSPNAVTLPAAGRYAIYIGAVEVLEVTDQIMASGADPWLSVKSLANGRAQPVEFIRRGMAPFDTPFAPGRPVMTFTVPAAGRYELTHMRRLATAAIVPDYVTGQESLLWTLYAVQLALVVGVPALLYYQRHRDEWEMAAQLKARRRAEVDAFWERQRSRTT